MSKNQITEITQAHRDRFPEFVEKWTEIGLCTDPMDKQRATSALNHAYECAGLDHPFHIFWCQSPYEAARVYAILQKETPLSDVEVLEDHHHKELDDYIRNYEGELDRESMRQSLYSTIHGYHEAGWLSFYDCYGEVFGMRDEVKILDGIMETARECGWYIPMTTCCIVSERTSILNRDDEYRLHSETTVAAGYPDGEGVWAIHGVRVPRDVIEDVSSITVERIDDEENVEIRRIMIDRYGAEKYVEDSGAEEIDRGVVSKSGDVVILYRKEVPDDETIIMAKVLNSTLEPDGSIKHYWLRVPPDIDTVKDAVAWGFSLEAKAYNPDVES